LSCKLLWSAKRKSYY